MPGSRRTTSKNSYETYKKNNQKKESNHGRNTTAKAKASTPKASTSAGLRGKVVLPKASTEGFEKPSAAEIAKSMKKADLLERIRSGSLRGIGGKASATVSTPFSFSSKGGLMQKHNAAQNAASYSLPTIDDYSNYSNKGGLMQKHNAAQNAVSYRLPTVDENSNYSNQGGIMQQHNKKQNEPSVASKSVEMLAKDQLYDLVNFITMMNENSTERTGNIHRQVYEIQKDKAEKEGIIDPYTALSKKFMDNRPQNEAELDALIGDDKSKQLLSDGIRKIDDIVGYALPFTRVPKAISGILTVADILESAGEAYDDQRKAGESEESSLVTGMGTGAANTEISALLDYLGMLIK